LNRQKYVSLYPLQSFICCRPFIPRQAFDPRQLERRVVSAPALTASALTKIFVYTCRRFALTVSKSSQWSAYWWCDGTRSPTCFELTDRGTMGGTLFISSNCSEGLFVVRLIFKAAPVSWPGPYKSNKTSGNGCKNGRQYRYYFPSALHRNTVFIEESSTEYTKSKRLATPPSPTCSTSTGERSNPQPRPRPLSLISLNSPQAWSWLRPLRTRSFWGGPIAA